MAKAQQKRWKKPKKELKTKITFLVEGEKTERYIIPGMFDVAEYKNIGSYKIEPFKGGSYSEITHWLERNNEVVDVVLVVCDLDRASNHTGAGNKAEKKALKKAIDCSEGLNIKNNFFLTYPNFEEWLAAGLEVRREHLYKALNYKSTSECKSDPKLLERYKKKNGDFAKAKKYFSRRKLLFYTKRNCSENGKIVDKNIDKIQSNLYYLEDYLGKLDKEK
jgi:hypothetical protein